MKRKLPAQQNKIGKDHLKPVKQSHPVKIESKQIFSDEYSDPSSDEESSEEDEYDFMTDIDKLHIGNLAFVPQYAELIILNVQKTELETRIPTQNFPQIQTEVTFKMRSIVIKWLVNVHHEFSLSSDTLFSSIYYFDYILSNVFVKKSKIQLLGTVCLWVASKLYDLRPPSVNDLIELCNTRYQISDFEEYERFVLNTLEFRLHMPHTKFFLKRFLDALELKPTLVEISNFICETSLFAYELNKFNPSTIAAAIIVISISLMNSYLPYEKLKSYAHLDNYLHVEECIPSLIFAAREVLDSKKGAIYQKYTSQCSSRILLRLEFNDELVNKIIHLHLPRH